MAAGVRQSLSTTHPTLSKLYCSDIVSAPR